jgi:hypothetical protein
MELNFLVPIEELVPNKIEWNYAEFLTEAKNLVAKYDGLIYEDNQISEAKEDRAKLRNYIKAIDNARKQIKSVITNPYAIFEQQIKDVTSVINDAVTNIDIQVKAYEENNRAKKRNEIEKIYYDVFGSLAECVPLEKIWNDKWLNVSVELSTIEKNIKEKKDIILTDMGAISSLKSENETELLAFYFETFSVAQTIAKNNEFKEKKELAQKAVSIEKVNKPINPSKPAPKKMEEPIAPVATEKVGTIILKFTAPLSKLVALREFIDKNEIQYEKL